MQRHRGIGVVLLVVFLAASCSVQLFAQGGDAALTGRITDPNGLPVVGVKVEAVNTETNVTSPTETNDAGLYTINSLTPGSYRILVEKEGFERIVKTAITLHVADVVALNFTLQIGSMAQSVTVTGEAPLVNTTSGSLGGLVDDHKIVELPLNGRNYADLTLLQPGIQQGSYMRQGSLGQAGTQYSANGAGVRSNQYLLDGAVLNNFQGENGGSAIGTTLGVDGIQEYRIITSAFSAQYGGAMGSQMILVSKGGTNQFHGDAFDFLRNNAFDARNFFDLAPSKLGGHRLPAFHRNNYGGSLGGPIRKDKTFFFGVYEGLSQVQGTTSTATVPQAGCHGNAGDTITLAACPSLNPPAGSGITSTTIQPQMAAYLALYPLPNTGTASYGFSFPSPTSDHYGQIRIDQVLSSKDTLFGRYTIDQSSQESPYGYPFFLTQYTGRNQFITLSDTHIFTTSISNTARVSFSRTNLQQQAPYLVNANGPQYSFVTGLPMGDIRVSGLTTIGTNTGGPTIDLQNVYSYSDDVDYIRGRHTFKFGALVNHYQMIVNSQGAGKGRVQFASIYQFLNANASAYTGVASTSILDRHFHFNALGFYAQDDWRVTSRLTLNLGLRYEPWTSYTEVNGYSSAIRNPLLDTTGTPGTPWDDPSYKNFGPRVGFGWDIFGNGKTALRGGFAELFDIANYGQQLGNQTVYSPPFSQATSVGTTSKPVTFTVPFTYNGGTSAPSTATFRGLQYSSKQPHMLQYNLTIERQLPGSMSLAVSYVGSRGINLTQTIEGNPNLPDGLPIVTGGVVTGCLDPVIVNGVPTNPLYPAGTLTTIQNSAGQTAQVFVNPALYSSQIYGNATSCYPGTPNRRNAAWASLLQTNNTGDSWYNGMQVVVNKRLSSGLQLQSAYTWSKNIDDTAAAGGGDGQGITNTVGEDDLHEKTNRSVGDYDVTHNWHTNVTYHIPNLTSSDAFESKIVNGWSVSGIFALQSGNPFTIFVGSNLSNTQENQGSSNPTDWPNINPGRNNSNITSGTSAGCGSGATRANGGTAIAAGTPLGTPNLYWDPCAYSLQPTGFLGNSSRNGLRGPGFVNLDFSITKDTPLRFLGEAGNLQFRAELFNILNHPNFAIPGYPGNGANGVEAFAAGLAAGATYPPTTQPNPPASAGVVTSTINTSRQIQFGLKIIF